MSEQFLLLIYLTELTVITGIVNMTVVGYHYNADGSRILCIE